MIAGERLPTLDELEAAAALIYRSMPATPQYRWPLLEARVGTTVWVKHENHAPTGAFKVRGGLVYLDRLLRDGKKPPGVVSATTAWLAGLLMRLRWRSRDVEWSAWSR